MGYFAPIRRVATLGAPIHLAELRTHPILKTAGFARGSMQSPVRVTPHWPELHDMIVQRNPAVRSMLSAYGPERVQ
jgi:hypothetical protein